MTTPTIRDKQMDKDTFLTKIAGRYRDCSEPEIEDLNTWVDKMQLTDWDLYPLYQQITFTWSKKTFPTMKFIIDSFYAIAPSFKKQEPSPGDTMSPERIYLRCRELLFKDEPTNADIDFRIKWDPVYVMYDLLKDKDIHNKEDILQIVKDRILKGEKLNDEYAVWWKKFGGVKRNAPVIASSDRPFDDVPPIVEF